jgi:hypothetical protein
VQAYSRQAPRLPAVPAVAVAVPAAAATALAAATAATTAAGAAGAATAVAAATATATVAAAAVAAAALALAATPTRGALRPRTVATRATGARSGFVDDELSPIERELIERLDRLATCGVVRHLDETEAARAAGLSVRDDGGRDDLPIGPEQVSKVVLTGPEGHVSYVESH